jgi:hypothetical protein
MRKPTWFCRCRARPNDGRRLRYEDRVYRECTAGPTSPWQQSLKVRQEMSVEHDISRIYSRQEPGTEQRRSSLAWQRATPRARDVLSYRHA